KAAQQEAGFLPGAATPTFFMTGLSTVNISQTTSNPAIIDDNGIVIPISQNLLHGAFGATDGGLTKLGLGTLALSGANTFNGNLRLNSGTLGINGATALGATGSALIINAANTTIDNTSAAAVTVTNSNPESWNFDFSYGGTRDLNTGAGA